MAAPSSDQTNPSRVARRAPASQAMRACGPPMALMTRELTTNGPMPTISIMLRATASLRPRPRSRDGCEAPNWGVAGGMDMRSENNKRAGILLSRVVAGLKTGHYKKQEHSEESLCHGIGKLFCEGLRGRLTLLKRRAQACRALRSTMKRNFILLMLGVCALVLAPCVFAAGNLSLPPGTDAILEHIYSGRGDLAIPAAQILQHAQPEHPLGYLLEAEARWWQIWCLSAEYKYGMSLPRHRGKAPVDQVYAEEAAKA